MLTQCTDTRLTQTPGLSRPERAQLPALAPVAGSFADLIQEAGLSATAASTQLPAMGQTDPAQTNLGLPVLDGTEQTETLNTPNLQDWSAGLVDLSAQTTPTLPQVPVVADNGIDAPFVENCSPIDADAALVGAVPSLLAPASGPPGQSTALAGAPRTVPDPPDPMPMQTPAGTAVDDVSGAVTEAASAVLAVDDDADEKTGDLVIVAPLFGTHQPQVPVPDQGYSIAPAGLASVNSQAAALPQVDLSTQSWPVQLADHVTAAAGKGESELVLEISPEKLGPLRLHIAVTEKGTEITVAAANPDVLAMLRDAQPDLQRSLAATSFSFRQGDGQQQQPAPRYTETLSPAGPARMPPAAIPNLAPVSGLNLFA